MSMDFKDLIEFRNNLQAMKNDMPDIMNELVVGEGVYAVKQARILCKNQNPDSVNTGDYRRNFHAGDKAIGYDGDNMHDGSKAKASNRIYKIDVYNNLDYAKHLEYGFRQHFVPGHWEGNTFVYNRNDPKGGMTVPAGKPYQPGRFIFRNAMRNTKLTQNARLNRKFSKIVKDYMERGRSNATNSE